jgi:hypothetical protein
VLDVNASNLLEWITTMLLGNQQANLIHKYIQLSASTTLDIVEPIELPANLLGGGAEVGRPVRALRYQVRDMLRRVEPRKLPSADPQNLTP